MFKGTTPTYTFTLPSEVDLSQIRNMYVTFAKSDGTEIVTKTNNDIVIDGQTVGAILSQGDTLSFPNGKVLVQLNWTYENAGRVKRACSDKFVIVCEKNLLNEVIN